MPALCDKARCLIRSFAELGEYGQQSTRAVKSVSPVSPFFTNRCHPERLLSGAKDLCILPEDEMRPARLAIYQSYDHLLD